MVYNRVTPNLLMIVLLLGGFLMSSKIKQEVFPAFELDIINITVPYPGAGPEEVEQGIILAIEEAIQGIEGIKEMTATAQEGSARVRAELLKDARPQKVLQDIQQEIDSISTLPVDAENPVISLVTRKRQVIRLNIFGNVPEHALLQTARQVRDKLLQNKDITQVELRGARDHEITVAVPIEKLRMHNLTLAEVAEIIKIRSIEIPGGKVETDGGEILLRVRDRRVWADEFGRIPIVTTSSGAVLYLEDIADVREGFEDSTRFATYNRMKSIQLRIARIGDQTPISVSEAAHAAMEEIQTDLPPAIGWAFSSDRSKIYKQRLELLLKNGLLGLVLVLILLGFFLELKLAFWVTMGIPISFLGSLLFLPFIDVSINMISMFAFIIALGIVVDDAIIAGENIYEYQQRGMSFIDAAIQGSRDVAVPITFSILTNIAAFLPLAFVPGIMGKVWRVIPLVVITVFLLSLVEALLILPSHLAHSKPNKRNPVSRLLHGWQQSFGRLTIKFINRGYGPVLNWILRYKFFTVSVLAALFLITIGYVKSGRISLILMPRVESDRAVVTATLPYGSPISEINRVHDQLLDGIEKVAKGHGDKQLLEGISSLVEENSIEINAYLTSPDIRPLSTRAVTKLWRKEVSSIADIKSVRYESDRGGPGSGAAISVELSHRNIDVLDRASTVLAEQLLRFPAIKDVDEGYAQGKIQFDFKVNELGASLGLNTTEVGRQVRNSFQGIIALRQQRGSDEVTVRVRLPQIQRMSEYDIESLLISTPASTFVPLSEIATVKQGRAYTSISRRDGYRTVMISANVDPIGQSSKILAALNSTILPDLAKTFPGLNYGYKGRQADRKDSLKQLGQGFIFTLGSIYFLLAIPFRSYIQPIVVMMAIPFGMIGAVLGHLLMGYNLSLMSMMGVVALSGIVINDSLVLIDYANKQRIKGALPFDAIRLAALRRFRPVLLTTLTTFGGLAPMMLETSRQARFLIPMAISLGFGIVFATVITLALVPSLYLIVEETKEMLRIS
ncbi:MAG: cobalt-zinc-cadmium resistance protein [Desulfobulbaceae bacterium S5133MH15]|nr:MAG: cobalt-zinc-cadmium resistance protein [Desulfobulbaceae bacterium S5133MH15]